MKKYAFDKSVYNTIFESLFGDEDIFSEENDEEDDITLIKKITDNDTVILKLLNDLYAKQKGMSKYGIYKPYIFSKIERKTIGGIEYKVIVASKERQQYVRFFPKGIKTYAGLVYIISSQELISYMIDNNIVISPHLYIEEEDTKFSSSTLVFNNVNIEEKFIKNICTVYSDNSVRNLACMYLYFNNTCIVDNTLQLILNCKNIHIYECFLKNGFKDIDNVSLNLNTDIQITIENEKTLKDLSITYNVESSYANNAAVTIKNCRVLANLSISDSEEKLHIYKLKVYKCPSINKETLKLPNHNTLSIKRLLSVLNLAGKVLYRGDIVTWFYMHSEVGSFYKYPKYYNYSMYYKKGAY